MSESLETVAFVMQLKEGFNDEYQKRHDLIWPELSALLKEAGISDYSIFLEPSTLKLFGVLKRTPDHSMGTLADHPIMKKWWAYMADIMDTHPDNSPIATELKPVFYLA